MLSASLNKPTRGGTYRVGLPLLGVDAAVDAPPEVLLRLPLPREDGKARLGQGCRHFVLEATQERTQQTQTRITAISCVLKNIYLFNHMFNTDESTSTDHPLDFRIFFHICLSYDCLTTVLRLSYDCLTTVLLLSYYCLTTVLRLSYDCLTTVLRLLSYDCLTTVLRLLSYDYCLTTVLRLSYDCHTTVLRLSYYCLTTVLRLLSYDYCLTTTVLRLLSYDCLTTVLRLSGLTTVWSYD